MLTDEAQRVYSMWLAQFKLYWQKNPKALHRTWLAFFLEAPQPGFIIFDKAMVIILLINDREPSYVGTLDSQCNRKI